MPTLSAVSLILDNHRPFPDICAKPENGFAAGMELFRCFSMTK